MHFETQMEEHDQLFDPEVSCPKIIKILNKSTKSKAKSSLPDILGIRKVDDHYSIFAKCPLPQASQFGPLEAPLVTRNEVEETNFLLKLDIEKCNRLENADKSYIYYDTTDENMCNWMMFVQPAKSYVEQNLCAHQEEDFIFFTSVREITPDEELKVWYSPSYARFLQVSVLTPSSGSINPPKIVASKLHNRRSKTSVRMQVYWDSMIPERDVRSVPPKKRVWRRSKDTRRTDGTGNNRFLSYSHYGDQRRVIRKTFVKIPKMFKCEVCEKSFKTKHKLRIHSVIHSDVRMFLCHHCGSTFKRQDKLRDHIINLHSNGAEKRKGKNTKPHANLDAFIFKCTDCGKGFQRRGMFVNHLIKMHPGMQTNSVAELACPIYKTVRDYLCPYCDKVYKSSTKRKLHIEKVHPGKELPISLRKVRNGESHANQPDINIRTRDAVASAPECCQYCERQYSSKHKLNKHVKEKHPETHKNDDTLPESLQDAANNADTVNTAISDMRQNTENAGSEIVNSSTNTSQPPIYNGDIYDADNMPSIEVSQQVYHEQREAYSNDLNHSEQNLPNQTTISPIEVSPAVQPEQHFTTLQNSNASLVSTPENHQNLPEQQNYTNINQKFNKERAYSRYPLGRKQIIIKYQNSQLQNAQKAPQSPQKHVTIDEVLGNGHDTWQEVPITHCETSTVTDIPVFTANHTYDNDSSNPILGSILDSVPNDTSLHLDNVRVGEQDPVLDGNNVVNGVSNRYPNNWMYQHGNVSSIPHYDESR